jgi:hypothetical protein
LAAIIGEPATVDPTDSPLGLGPGHMVLVSPEHELRGLFVRLAAAEWQVVRAA